MMPQKDPRKLILHYEYPAESNRDSNHAIAAVALANSIQQLQRVINFLAKCQSGMSVNANLGTDDRLRYSLVCDATLKPGSLSMPLYIGHDNHKDVVWVSRMFHEVAKQLNQADVEGFRKLLPDTNFHRPLIDACKKMLPPDFFRLEFSIQDENHQTIFTGRDFAKLHSELKPYLFDGAVEVETYFISGFLTGIDLEKKEVQVKLKTGQHLVASYSEVDDAESTLFHNLGQPIFLYGDVGFNKDDDPVFIRNVNKILAVDESSIEVSEVKINNAVYRTDSPLKFNVTFDSTAFCYDLKGDFDIYIFEETRDELEVSLEDELQFLWNEFGEEQTDPLSPDALKLQAELRSRLTATD